MSLLETIHSPGDVKRLSLEEKKILCEEIRNKIIATVSNNGGHLASNLGVVELTVAIHSVFDSPKDSIIFDVGHQCYTHKLLTGRSDLFDTLRQEEGLSGFMKPSESPHDPVITGHSSSSISAALGIAKGNTLRGVDAKSVAVIGDGAMTGGMAFEALNNAGHGKDNLVIILNDNKMSIGRNVGGFPRHLTVMRTRPSYYRFKRLVDRTIARIPKIGTPLRNAIVNSKTALKNAIYHSNMFEDLGIHYYGPIDGHDLERLLFAMEVAKNESRPVLIHVITTKGKGYAYAEKNPKDFHGVSAFDPAAGCPAKGGRTFSDVFGEEMCTLAQADARICAITAAMCGGTGLSRFEETFKNRFFDVGIAEQHAVTFAAGLAKTGLIPVFAVYSSFLQRGFDQIIHDAAIGRMHIVLAVDRAGIVGEDGETHQGLFDAGFLSEIPGVAVYSPSTFNELRTCLRRAALEEPGVVAVRYPRGSEPALPAALSDGEKDFLLSGDGKADLLFVTYGRETAECAKAAEALRQDGYSADVLKLLKISPLPAGVLEICKFYKFLLFAEEGERSGGIGEHLAAHLLEAGWHGRFLHAAVPDTFVSEGTVAAGIARCGLDAGSLTVRVEHFLKNEVNGNG
ncbi:MAG: 1-deoxy-D-xylulose-5-phosphate synthase [Candidatus Howiella sp.]|jgi:1-deoxy-D-xylulose-5-phosphate synthase